MMVSEETRMRAWFKAQFGPVAMTAQELAQKRRLLFGILWMQLGMTALIGIVDLTIGTWSRGLLLMVAAAAAVPCILLNRRGHYILAAGLATAVVLAVIDVILYMAGGIHDRVIAAFPIFVMLAALLFSRRSLPYVAIAAIGSVIGLGLMEMSRQPPAVAAQTLEDTAVICLMTIGAGLIVSVALGGLEENLRRAHDTEIELRKAYDRTLEGWSTALGYRDFETQGHAQRVVKLCMRLAKEWAFSQDRLAHIYRGALLHDIGKMAIPDQILRKSGPLSSSEWKVMKQHPVVAGEMLGKIPYLRPALSIPVYHHERWDGKGYPRGARGSRIPLEARIFAVVDQYDALTSNRPYRRAWPRRKALEYIRENAGRKFDPQVCEAFIGLWEAGVFGEAA